MKEQETEGIGEEAQEEGGRIGTEEEDLVLELHLTKEREATDIEVAKEINVTHQDVPPKIGIQGNFLPQSYHF